VVFNCLHGEYGEDGQVQRLLESLGVPYTGSGSLASALGMNKLHAKKFLVQHGIKMARHVHATNEDDPVMKARDVVMKFAPPYIVKPADRGSSVGLYFVKTPHELSAAIRSCLEVSNSVLVEEYIKGREATCGVVEKMRGQHIYPLLPIEIRPPKDRPLFDYEAKYSGRSKKFARGCLRNKKKRS
jgi:D-alanine-D-alanine ligase